MGKNKLTVLFCIIAVFPVLVQVLLPQGLFGVKLFVCFILMPSALCGLIFVQRSEIKKLDGMLAGMRKELAKFSFEAQVASSQVSSVSEQLHVTLDENNAFVQQLFAEIAEMARYNTEANESAEGTVLAVKDIIGLLEESNANSAEMRKKSESSNNVIKSSMDEIMKIVNIINEIEVSANKTIECISRLGNSSREIVGILEMVNNISRQTQLLSLNASIESSRAGEAGKGFAVVAEEIRKLSAITADAVNDIKNLAMHIQNEVGIARKAVEENTGLVEKSVEMAGCIEKNLKMIDISLNELLRLVQTNNELSRREAGLTLKIKNNIESLEEKARINNLSVKNVIESVNRQKNNIGDIAEMSGRLYESAGNLARLFDSSGAPLQISYGCGVSGAEKHIDDCRRIFEELFNTPGFLSLDKALHHEILNGIKEKNEFVEAIWTNDCKGRFICSIPRSGIANAAVREWFRRSVNGEEYISPVYISAITKMPCITFSVPIRSKTGEITGVAGIDLKIGPTAGHSFCCLTENDKS